MENNKRLVWTIASRDTESSTRYYWNYGNIRAQLENNVNGIYDIQEDSIQLLRDLEVHLGCVVSLLHRTNVVNMRYSLLIVFLEHLLKCQ